MAIALAGACAPDVSAQNLVAGVVKIRNDVKARTGSGFVTHIVPGRLAIVATAQHVIEDDAAPEVWFHGEIPTKFTASVFKQQPPSADALALLLVEGAIPANAPALSLDRASVLTNGERVTVVGFPIRLRTDWAVSDVQVVGRRDGSTLVLTGFVNEGHSGGPVLKNGRVVGMIYGGDTQSYALPSAVVGATLDGWLDAVRDRLQKPDFCFTVDRLTSMAESDFAGLRNGPPGRDTAGRKTWSVPADLDLSDSRDAVIRSDGYQDDYYFANVGGALSTRDMPGYWQTVVERVRACKPGWKVQYKKANEARFEAPSFRDKIMIDVGVRDAGGMALAYIAIGNRMKSR